ncbi:MAG TPA: hypothetical protein VJ845_03295 [Haploplasma sp.]|nr:hypothetical protein [Haploplasma sp.]
MNTNRIDINPAKKIKIKNTNKDLPFRVRAINTKNNNEIITFEATKE